MYIYIDICAFMYVCVCVYTLIIGVNAVSDIYVNCHVFMAGQWHYYVTMISVTCVNMLFERLPSTYWVMIIIIIMNNNNYYYYEWRGASSRLNYLVNKPLIICRAVDYLRRTLLFHFHFSWTQCWIYIMQTVSSGVLFMSMTSLRTKWTNCFVSSNLFVAFAFACGT